MVGQNCTADAGCDAYFLATEGAVEIDSLDDAGSAIKGRLTNVKMQEVTVDFDTYVSTPVANGSQWCIGTSEFDTTPECVEDVDCLDAAKPFCAENVCVACSGLFDYRRCSAGMCCRRQRRSYVRHGDGMHRR
ncbi:MAG: hypothetical protein R3E66_22275 [bacterium]